MQMNKKKCPFCKSEKLIEKMNVYVCEDCKQCSNKKVVEWEAEGKEVSNVIDGMRSMGVPEETIEKFKKQHGIPEVQ